MHGAGRVNYILQDKDIRQNNFVKTIRFSN